ncbi:hypothetical protein QCA50_014403 [Cerrena zonata]|uniref:Enoyl reductase (ER) domain-containing protein n=1 Tax=Cerrena zonata TaxID=2478898 RepID=A0AAW0FNN6_9APHY
MSLPTQQKALLVPLKGKFYLGSSNVNQPGPGEVLVRIEATALNPVDWKIPEAGYFVTEWPAILGTDSAGVVVAVGEGVSKFTAGDKIFHQGYFTNRLATFQEYTIIRAEIAAKIPSNLTFDQAASIPLGFTTAAVGLYAPSWAQGGFNLTPPWKPEGKNKYAGQPIVIFGGSSSVGTYAIQLAKLSGFSPIITTVSPHNSEFVKSLGATHTIDRSLSPSEIAAEAIKITSAPLKIVYDAISLGPTQQAAFEVLAPGGSLLLVLPSQIPKEKVTGDTKVITTFGSVHAPDNASFGVDLYNHITELFASGEIKPNVVEVLPGGLAGIPEGLERMKKDLVSGKKLVAHPTETA